MIRKTFILFITLSNFLVAQEAIKKVEGGISDTFPVPTTKNLLFYVQRTHNKNTIVYDINYNADSTINNKKPVNAYWIRYSDGGGEAPLSYIQQHYAYGIRSELVDSVKMIFKLNFVSYEKRDIYLIKNKTDKKYKAYIYINGKLSVLTKIFVKIEGGTFWVPHITSVEISGISIPQRNVVKEIFKP